MIGRFLHRLVFALAVFSLGGCAFHQSIGASTGAYLDPVSGENFVHIPNTSWDSSRDALLYFYRPHSQWAADELESPSVYVDGKHYFNLRDNSYTWLEVYPGQRHIVMRRPLLGFEGLGSFNLNKIVDAKLDVKAGHIYYLRYSEVDPPKQTNPDLDQSSPLATGSLQLVARDYAMTEIVDTHFLNSDSLAANDAARSIVAHNREYDYTQEKAQLQKDLKDELNQMKEQGFWHPAPWYWPFGGGPTREPKAQEKLDALEKSHDAWLESQKKPSSGFFSWWPF